MHYKETTAWIRKHKIIRLALKIHIKPERIRPKKMVGPLSQDITRLQYRPLVRSVYKNPHEEYTLAGFGEDDPRDPMG